MKAKATMDEDSASRVWSYRASCGRLLGPIFSRAKETETERACCRMFLSLVETEMNLHKHQRTGNEGQDQKISERRKEVNLYKRKGRERKWNVQKDGKREKMEGKRGSVTVVHEKKE